MSEHGTMLNPDASPKLIALRQMMCSYFGNPTMTKVASGETGIANYAAEPRFNIGGGSRMLHVLTLEDGNSIGTTYQLSQLEWEVLQTFQVEDNVKKPECLQFTYSPSNSYPFSSPLAVTSRNSERVEYYSPLEVNIALLVKPGGSQYDYPPKGTLGAAIETYQTIVRLPEDI